MNNTVFHMDDMAQSRSSVLTRASQNTLIVRVFAKTEYM
jgi:hypothetical protein